MPLKSLTYISVASPTLSAADVYAIHSTATHLNALDGVTGLLIYNGRHFCQLVEGVESAIDDLVARLRRDSRHSEIVIEDERTISEREFPGWSMQLAQVSIDFLEARENIIEQLPTELAPSVRAKIVELVGTISAPRA